MNADAFRHLYEYHFTANRKIWDTLIMALTQEQFTQKVDYSVGSVRNQVVHLLSVDDLWFGDLRGVPGEGFLDPEQYAERKKIRAKWDEVEQNMRGYLEKLQDDMLFTRPLAGTDDDEMYLWQVLIHVINHGTDHRAQMLMLLNNLGQKTSVQDYFFYIKGDL